MRRRLAAVAIPISAVLLMAKCAGDTRTALVNQHLSARVSSESDGAFALTSFRKTKGFRTPIPVKGVELYTMEWAAEITVLRDVLKDGNALIGYWEDFSVRTNQPSWWEPNAPKRLAQGSTVEITGTATLMKTKAGWRVEAADVAGARVTAAQGTPAAAPASVPGSEGAPAPSEVDLPQRPEYSVAAPPTAVRGEQDQRAAAEQHVAVSSDGFTGTWVGSYSDVVMYFDSTGKQYTRQVDGPPAWSISVEERDGRFIVTQSELNGGNGSQWWGSLVGNRIVRDGQSHEFYKGTIPTIERLPDGRLKLVQGDGEIVMVRR